MQMKQYLELSKKVKRKNAPKLKMLPFLFLLFTLTGCTDAEVPISLPKQAHSAYQYADITLSLPDDWAWEEIPADPENSGAGFGIRFYPEAEPDAETELFFMPFFGVCGTDLAVENITLPGGETLAAYIYGDGNPSFYRYRNMPGNYVASLMLDDAQYAQYSETILTILDSTVLADGIIRENTALTLAGITADNKETPRYTASFDETTGTWSIDIYDTQRTDRVLNTYQIDAAGEQVQCSIYCYSEE